MDLRKTKAGIVKTTNELSLDYAWLKAKHNTGQRQNLKDAISEVRENLISTKMVSLILTTSIMAGTTGSILAYKRTFWSDSMKDTKSAITTPPSTNHEISSLLTLFSNKIKESAINTHRKAPYAQYATNAALISSTAITLGICGASIRTKRNEDEENTLDNNLS